MDSEDEEFEFRLRAEQEAGQTAEKPKRKTPMQMSDNDQAKLGLAETGLSIATGAAGSVVGGLAGIGGAMLPGPPGQGANVAQKVQNAMTYQPRTEAGQEISAKAAYLPQKLSEFADWAGGGVSEATGSPLLGTAVNTGIQALPAIVSRGAKGIVQKNMADVGKQAARDSVKDTTLARAQAEGYVVPPTSTAGKAATSIAGKAHTLQEAAVRNQEITNKIARREAGLAENEPISDHTLEVARERMSEPYREVQAMSPIAAKALEGLKAARADAKAWHRYYDRSADPRALKKAQAFDQKAAGYENTIDRIAQGSKNPKLLADLREARMNLAKNYDIERALNPGDGNVDARAIGRKLKNGAPLSDGMETIGRFAQAHPQVTRPAASVGLPGATHGTALEMGLGYAHGGLLGAGVPLIRGPMRGLALSKMMQPGPTKPSLGLRLSDVATRPAASGAAVLTPSMGLRPPQEDR